MKVKIGNTVYDSNVEPIMIVLSDIEKNNISQMLEECHKYCSAPDSLSEDEMREFMKVNE